MSDKELAAIIEALTALASALSWTQPSCSSSVSSYLKDTWTAIDKLKGGTMTDNQTTLRECPVCGEEVWKPMPKRWTNVIGDKSWSAYVYCPKCGLSIETKSIGYETAEDAIDAAAKLWNSRSERGTLDSRM